MSSRGRRSRSRSKSPDSAKNSRKKEDRPWLRSSSSRSRSRSRSPGHKSKRRRSRSGSPTRPVASKLPKYVNSRVFVANVNYDTVSSKDLEDLFKKHGRVIDVLVHPNGYGFVQFTNEEDGQKAVAAEANSFLGGKKIKCNMAAEGKRNQNRNENRGPPPRDNLSDGRDRDRGPPPRDMRDRSPLRDPYGPPGPPYGPLDPYRRDLPPPPRDPYFDDPYRRQLPPDPYFDRLRDDPYRRDPYMMDPYRDPYRDPFPRDPLYDPLAPKKPTDCEIVVMNAQLRDYADLLERRLRNVNLVTSVVVIREDRTIQQQVEDATRRNCLFAIIINSQNELHRSLTLNILHGVPQEHRNMPMDDALALVARSFEKYLATEKEKAAAASVAAPGAGAGNGAKLPMVPVLPPPKEISYLLNLLADSRQLTIDEIDKVIAYLRERKDRLLEAEGLPPASAQALPPPQAPEPPRPLDPVEQQLKKLQELQEQHKQQQQQELQTKILSMMNGSTAPPKAATSMSVAQTSLGTLATTTGLSTAALGAAQRGIPPLPPAAPPQMAAKQPSLAGLSSSLAGLPPSLAGFPPGLQGMQPRPQPPPKLPASAAASSAAPSATLINFDNPTVQKALDNLIQSGPNLLRNISTSGLLQATAPPPPPHPSSAGGGGMPKHY